jgi:hypothetical protein
MFYSAEIKKQMSLKAFVVTMGLISALTLSTRASAHGDPQGAADSLASLFEPSRQTPTMLINVRFDDYATGMMKLHELHVDIAGVDIQNRAADVVVDETELRKLEQLGFKTSVQTRASALKGPDARYQTPAEIEKALQDFHHRHPALTEIKEVGKSLQGRPIWAIRISNHSNDQTLSKPAVLFNAMHHAREVMGPEVALDIIGTLLGGYGKDPRITHWVDSNQIWVMPMLNVDGNNIVWTSDKMWRKNARENYGVDINRNYPFAWGSCNGSSDNTGAADYRGPSAASEPETRVMMDFVKEIRPVFDISYHSFSELVIYPMGCDGQRTRNKEVVESIGKEMGDLLGYKAGTPWETLYAADGLDIDWMHSAYQVIPYVIEVNSMAEGFQPDFSKRQPTVELNRKAWRHLLDRLDGPGIRGQVSRNGASVSDFTLTIQRQAEGKFAEYMTYTGNPDGSFHLVLNPGKYRLKLNAAGVEKSEEVLVGDSRTDLDFTL